MRPGERRHAGIGPRLSPVADEKTGRHVVHVVLVHPEIHWNTGNAGRSCLAAGAELHMVEPLGFSLDEREVKRAGLHYWKHVRPRVWPDWASLEAELPGLGEPFLFTARGDRELWQVRFPARSVVLVFGGESAGLPEEIRQRHAGREVRIPLSAHAGISLNLSTAVGIALYEAVRQRESDEPCPAAEFDRA